MHVFIKNYWSDWFPRLPAYQTFVCRLNQLEHNLSKHRRHLVAFLDNRHRVPEIDRIGDLMPVMLAANAHCYTAKVARDIANIGY